MAMFSAVPAGLATLALQIKTGVATLARTKGEIQVGARRFAIVVLRRRIADYCHSCLQVVARQHSWINIPLVRVATKGGTDRIWCERCEGILEVRC